MNFVQFYHARVQLRVLVRRNYRLNHFSILVDMNRTPAMGFIDRVDVLINILMDNWKPVVRRIVDRVSDGMIRILNRGRVKILQAGSRLRGIHEALCRRCIPIGTS